MTKVPHVVFQALLGLAFLSNAVSLEAESQERTPPSQQFERLRVTGRSFGRHDSRFRVADPCFEFGGGVALRPAKSSLRSLRWFDGSTSSGLLGNGQALVLWPSLFERPLPEVRIAETAERAGQEMSWVGPEPAVTHPKIRGYRYVTSAMVSPDDYIGLWRAGAANRTLIVSFRTARDAVPLRIGALSLSLNSVFVSSPLHGSWGITFTGVSAGTDTVSILHYRWRPPQFRRGPNLCIP